jgi:hypothetical protein
MDLHITLRSDASFASGEGVAGLIDSELQHDRHGLPYLRGRSLKGLLAEECANLLDSLARQGGGPASEQLDKAAAALFGIPGADPRAQGRLYLGDARLPDDLRQTIASDIRGGRLTPVQVLESLSAIRRRTAMNERGAPRTGSLRSQRVLLRETTLIAGVSFGEDPDPTQLALLAACAMGLRRAGSDRNRGLGRLRVCLYEEDRDTTDRHWDCFTRLLEEDRT